MTCGERFHGAGADSPMTLREAAHGRVSSEKGLERSLLHNDTRRVDIPPYDDQFSFLPDHWYSLCIFFFHVSVYFSLSGDVRACACSSPAVTAQSVYRWPSGGTRCVLF